jgi:hypothetical protein
MVKQCFSRCGGQKDLEGFAAEEKLLILGPDFFLLSDEL